MKKKGFTLIELLAVIVILAVIALIATPAVLNVIEDSKKAAAEASARNIVSSAETYYLKELMNNNKVSSIDLSTDTLKYDGDKAEKGYVNLDANGKGSGKMYISGYCVTVTSKSELTSEKVDADDCDTTNSTSSLSFTNGETVYYNPETNTKCTEAEANANTSKNTGCLKWYSYLDKGGDKVTLLLSHNTSNGIAWLTEDDYTAAGSPTNPTPITANKQLNTDTSSWNTSIKSSIRLLSVDEIKSIIGEENWQQIGYDYFFHPGEEGYGVSYGIGYGGGEVEAGANNYAWLFDNISNCTTYGCNAEDADAHGFWTSTLYGKNYSDNFTGYYVTEYGSVRNHDAGNLKLGIRPVIEVEKTILK